MQLLEYDDRYLEMKSEYDALKSNGIIGLNRQSVAENSFIGIGGNGSFASNEISPAKPMQKLNSMNPES
jgi:hypothetical protein